MPTPTGQAGTPSSVSFQGRLVQTRKSGYFPSSSVKPCPVDGRVSTFHRSFWNTVAGRLGILSAVSSLGGRGVSGLVQDVLAE